MNESSNGLGVAAFVLAILSLCGFGGCLAPVSLVLAIIAMQKEPKGLAIAALVISIVQLAPLFILVGLFAVLGSVGAVMGVVLSVFELQVLMVEAPMTEIVDAIEAHEAEHDALPESLESLGVVTDDPWGRPYHFITNDDGTWRLTTDGPDGEPGTNDDVTRLDDGTTVIGRVD